MHHSALEAHARDEIGITAALSARPTQAAFGSAVAFAIGASVPVMTVAVAPTAKLLWLVPLLAIGLLGTLGGIASMIGGASPFRGAVRVCFWGSLAMALTAAVGKLFGIALQPVVNFSLHDSNRLSMCTYTFCPSPRNIRRGLASIVALMSCSLDAAAT